MKPTIILILYLIGYNNYYSYTRILGAHAGRESEVHGNAIIITIMYYICGTCMYYCNNNHCKHVFNEHIHVLSHVVQCHVYNINVMCIYVFLC